MPIKTHNRVIPALSSRRLRYRNDLDYRENAKKLSRRAYRRKTNMEMGSCLHSLNFLEALSRVEEVQYPDGRIVECRVLSLPKTADALQKLYQTVWRWVNSGMIPRPCLFTLTRPAKPIAVYHIDEVRALVEEIGNHEREVAYFRKDHRDVRERIEQRISGIRNTLFA